MASWSIQQHFLTLDLKNNNTFVGRQMIHLDVARTRLAALAAFPMNLNLCLRQKSRQYITEKQR